MTNPEASASLILFFDGECLLCRRSVRFIIRRDRKKLFRFASLQSKLGQQILKDNHFELDNFKTFILSENKQLYTYSTAWLRIMKRLPYPWKLLAIGYLMPRRLRDGIYNYVAKKRYQWFGKTQQCLLDDGLIKERLIE